MLNNYMKIALATTSLAIMGISTAQAVPAYAYSTLHFENFILSGIVDASGAPVSGVSAITQTVTSTDSANYPGAPASGFAGGGNLVIGTDAPQASSGPGAFPGQNVFTQALLPATSLTPAGTRGDLQVSGAIAGGATSNLVAEGKLSTLGSAGSNASTSTTINATFANTGSVNLTFAASSALFAQVGLIGDSANAQFSASYTVNDVTGTGQTPVSIFDNISGSTFSGSVSPGNLNRNIATTVPADIQSFTSTLTNYSYTVNVIPGHTYQFTLADNTTTIFTGVPEPLSITLLGTGLIALGALRRKV